MRRRGEEREKKRGKKLLVWMAGFWMQQVKDFAPERFPGTERRAETRKQNYTSMSYLGESAGPVCSPWARRRLFPAMEVTRRAFSCSQDALE